MTDVRIEGREVPTVIGQAGPLPEELRIGVRDVGEAAWGLAGESGSDVAEEGLRR